MTPTPTLSPYHTALRERIVAQCRAMFRIDPEYAEWAFDSYAANLPWLGLVRRDQQSGEGAPC